MPRLLLLVLLTVWVLPVSAGELRVAVAANFTATLERLAEVYREETGTRLSISSGSTGKHYAQIVQGAPYDLFFAADDRRSRDLVERGLASAASRFVYAEGVVVLWSPEPGRIPEHGPKLFEQDEPLRIAIANPRVAPYGAAARALLAAHGIELPPRRLVTGQSLGQAFNFIATGNTDAGFVALSQVIVYEREHGAGSRWEPAIGSYPPVVQEAVALNRSADPAAAQGFLDWVRTDPTARAIIKADGYRLP